MAKRQVKSTEEFFRLEHYFSNQLKNLGRFNFDNLDFQKRGSFCGTRFLMIVVNTMQ